MSYTGAIKYLYDLQKYGIKLGLGRTEKILSVLGNPHCRFLSVHVAGTNGKGSAAAIIASMLMSGGAKVGLFTSPHLVSFTERIRIDNKQISEEEVARLTGEIHGAIAAVTAQEGEPTFFEFVTAMAFLYFARNNVDWAVIEVGMGGRLDSTNIITPAVSVITGISYDHQSFLGNSLSAIASEKAGIIKNNVPVVCSPQEPEAERVLRARAGDAGSPLFSCGRDFSGTLISTGLAGTRFNFLNADHSFKDLFVPLAGEHQVLNASVAVQTFLLCSSLKSPLGRGAGVGNAVEALDAIGEGLAATRWQGRLELVHGNPPILLDGAHNPHAAQALSEFIKIQFPNRRIVLIAGIMSDKDIAGILAPLLPLASAVIFTAPNYGRSAPPGILAEHAASLGFQSIATRSVAEAIASAGEMAPSLILITGSFFTVGEAKELLGEKALLGDLREHYEHT